MSDYPKPKLFNPSKEELEKATKRLVVASMENTAHSYTEAAEYIPERTHGSCQKKSAKEFFITHLEISMALSKFLELHKREAGGDETITQKEWNTAISNGSKALENAVKVEF